MFLIPFMLTCSMRRFLSLSLLGLWSCGRLSSVVVVVVHYVDAVVAVTCVLLFLCLLKECDGARLMAMLLWGMDEVWLW